MSKITDKLRSYADLDPIRFHMPGHIGYKFGTHLDPVLPYDVTETDLTDDLYAPEQGGSVDQALLRLSEYYKTTATVISAGGATLCLQSAVYCAKKAWNTSFLVDSRCHKSVFNALSLIDADVSFFDIDSDISELFEGAPLTVIVTSPDYYGKIADTKKLSLLCKKNNSHLIVDNSHGSHLYHHESGKLHPLNTGADLVVDSIHKTMPAVTGSALLHSKCQICRKDLLDGIRLFGSTSPSYIISSSADTCCEFMINNGKELLSESVFRIRNFESSLSDTKFYRKKFPLFDPYRITLCSHTNVNMYEVQAYLHEQGIVPEFSDGENLVLIPSIFSSDSDFKALHKALKDFNFNDIKPCKRIDFSQPRLFSPIVKPSQTLFAKKHTVKTKECTGMIAGELKYLYPPGIPYIIPGVIIDKNKRSVLEQLGIEEITVIEE